MTRYVLRPFWVIGLTCLLVFLACPWLPSAWWLPCAAIALGIGAAAVLIPPLRRVHSIALVAATAAVAVLVFYGVWVTTVQSVPIKAEEPITLSVRVVESDTRVVLAVEDGAIRAGTRMVWYPPNREIALEVSDRFTSSFVLDEYSDGTQFSLLMRRASGVWLRATQVDVAQLNATLVKGDGVRSIFEVLRESLSRAPIQRLQGNIGAVIAGICYGADETLSSEATEAFRTCGVSHLFAVSGLHMTVLLQALQWLLRRIRVRRVARLIVCGAFLLGFMLIVGFSSSVVRAGTLCLVVLLGNGIKREADTRNSLGLALLILLLANPFAAYDAGLLLSFSATYGLLCFSRPIQAVLMKGRLPRWLEAVRKPLVSVVAVSVAATVATLPVMAIYFGRVSIVSVLSNLLTTLPAEIALITGMVSSVLTVVGLPVLADPLMMVAGVSARYLLWICQKISTFSFATVAFGSGFLLLWLLGTYCAWAIGFRVLNKHGKAALAAVCVIALCSGILLRRGARYDTLEVAVASQQDLAVAIAYHGCAVAVLSPSDNNSAYDLRDALQDLGVTRLDVLCLVGGKEPAVSYVPSVLSAYLASDTQVLYDELPWLPPLSGQSLDGYNVTLGTELFATGRDDHVELVWDEHTLCFFTSALPEVACEAAAAFGAGETPIMIKTAEGSRLLPAGSGPFAYRDGRWVY